MDGFSTPPVWIAAAALTYQDEVNADSPLATRNLAGSAETFNGSTRYALGTAANVNAMGTSGEFTLEGIISVNATSGDGSIMGAYNSTESERLCIFWMDGGASPSFSGTGRDVSGVALVGLIGQTASGYTVATSTEYHVAYVFSTSGNVARVFVNGIERHTSGSLGSFTLRTTGSTPMYVGDDGSGGRYLTGTGRGYAMYATALSATRIAAHATAAGF